MFKLKSVITLTAFYATTFASQQPSERFQNMFEEVFHDILDGSGQLKLTKEGFLEKKVDSYIDLSQQAVEATVNLFTLEFEWNELNRVDKLRKSKGKAPTIINQLKRQTLKKEIAEANTILDLFKENIFKQSASRKVSAGDNHAAAAAAAASQEAETLTLEKKMKILRDEGCCLWYASDLSHRTKDKGETCAKCGPHSEWIKPEAQCEVTIYDEAEARKEKHVQSKSNPSKCTCGEGWLENQSAVNAYWIHHQRMSQKYDELKSEEKLKQIIKSESNQIAVQESTRANMNVAKGAAKAVLDKVTGGKTNTRRVGADLFGLKKMKEWAAAEVKNDIEAQLQEYFKINPKYNGEHGYLPGCKNLHKVWLSSNRTNGTRRRLLDLTKLFTEARNRN